MAHARLPAQEAWMMKQGPRSRVVRTYPFQGGSAANERLFPGKYT